MIENGRIRIRNTAKDYIAFHQVFLPSTNARSIVSSIRFLCTTYTSGGVISWFDTNNMYKYISILPCWNLCFEFGSARERFIVWILVFKKSVRIVRRFFLKYGVIELKNHVISCYLWKYTNEFSVLSLFKFGSGCGYFSIVGSERLDCKISNGCK